MGKSAPAAPDPVATANAQGAINAEAARTTARMNRGDTFGPGGSVVNEEVGPDKWRQTTTLAPNQQAAYDATNATARDATVRMQALLNNGLRTDDLPQWGGQVNMPNLPFRSSIGGAGQGLVQSAGGAGQDIRADFGEGSPRARVSGAGQGVQTGFDDGAALGRVGPDDFSGDRRRVEDALLSRTEPAAQRDRADLEARLAAQGFTPGSQGYQNSADELNRARNDARMQAVLAGGAEQSRLFGMDINRTGFNNQASQTETAARNQAMQLGNAAQAQSFGQGVAQAGFNNDASGAETQARNAALQAGNQAQQQGYAQRYQDAGLNNEAQQAGFDQQAREAAFTNTGRGQLLNEGYAASEFQTRQRSQMLAERLQARAQPINEVSALFGLGNGIQVPQASQQAPVQVGAPDYQGLVSNEYKAKSAAAASGNAAAAGAAASLASAAVIVV